MRAFLDKSLGIRLMSAIIVIIVIALAALTAIAIVQERSKARQGLLSKGETLIGLLAYGSRMGVFAENRDLLNDVAAGIVTEPDVALVGIYTADGKTLYEVNKDPGKQGTRSAAQPIVTVRQGGVISRETGRTLEFTKPVVLAASPAAEDALYFDVRQTDRTIGRVSIVLDKKALNRETVVILKRNGSMALVFIFVSAAVVALSVRKITRPLKTLTETVRVIGRGEEAAPMPVTGADEIGKLAAAFNAMVEERRQADIAIRESEKKYRTLFEESIHVVFITAPDGTIIDVNPAGVSLFGYASREELMAMNVLRDLYVNSDDRAGLMRIIEGQGFVRDYAAKFRKKSGEILDIVITATAVYDHDGNLAALRGMLRDVTAERSLEGQLRQSQKMEAVGRLTGGVAHDFNNILTAIVSYAHHLEVRLSKKKDPLASYAEKIISAGDKAADLVRSLLVFSRKQILNAQAIDLNELVSGNADLLARVVGQDVKLSARLTGDALVVNVDAGQMAHAIMNLASNARDSMPAGGPLTIATKRVRLDHEFVKVHGYGEPGEYAVLSVTDAGGGMDAATTKKIFEPFFTTKEQGKGTGLGLSIVYGIVKQHNGYIDVASEPGQGSTFTVYLPLLDAGDAAAASAPEGLSFRGSETILVAENDDEARLLIRSVLSEAGYTVIAAADGEDALRLFHEHQDAVDLLLLEMVMPKKNGMQVSVEAGKARPGIRTIFLSAIAGGLLKNQKPGAEELHFLAKPVVPAQLLQKTREVLDA